MKERAERHAEAFAEAMIEAIRKGTAPWQRPWKAGAEPWPRNFSTGRPYHGTNLMLLMATGIDRGYADARWGGFGQIRRAGGHVRKGERGTPVLIVRPRPTKRVETVDPAGQTVEEERGGGIYVTMQHVFNVEQADGLDIEAPEAPEQEAWSAMEAVEAVAADTEVEIREGAGNRACYVPAEDVVRMPGRERFEAGDAYYHTLLHELGHATAHPSRMDRPEFTTEPDRRTVAYALEELRAEMAAMMAGARLGIGHSPRHGEAYVAHWLDAAGQDGNAIRDAARDAQRITDWLLRKRTQDGQSELAEAA